MPVVPLGNQRGDLFLDLKEVQTAYSQPGDDSDNQTDSNQHGDLMLIDLTNRNSVKCAAGGVNPVRMFSKISICMTGLRRLASRPISNIFGGHEVSPLWTHGTLDACILLRWHEVPIQVAGCRPCGSPPGKPAKHRKNDPPRSRTGHSSHRNSARLRVLGNAARQGAPDPAAG